MGEKGEAETLKLTRQRIAFYLDDLETPIGRFVSFSITGLILLSSVIFVVQTYHIPPEVRYILEKIDRGIVIIFACEYLIRFWVAEDKIKFFLNPFSLIDSIAILPYFFGFFNVSFIRILRWFRILRLIRFIEVKLYIFRLQTEDGIIFARIIFTLLTIIFVFSGLIYQVESPVNPQIFGTFLDAVYFSVVTMTTVGYGDVVPFSEPGRFLTILMILTGIALIPWQIGDLIKQLVKTANKIETTCSGCGWMSHDQDALYCKRCGTLLNANRSSKS
ncbi:ion transporter [Capilliphycus salinus ALCB114379]|uniref:ion transporter n=1 Tax=Capilliphycus salinus TaxID=2768948 RepID=UPI0039A56B56